MGAGIVGCSAAAFLAEAGADVVVVDREGVAAGASGRNSGVLQHPYDEALVPLHEESMRLHREVLDLPPEPAGILLLGAPRDLALPPELASEWLEEARSAEPLLAPGLSAVRIATGWPLGPRDATEAWARRARAAGATFASERPDAAATLLATGAWTTAVPVVPVWGVTATVELDEPPGHILEEAGVEAIAGGGDGDLFSLVTSARGTVLGSTLERREPDPARTVARVRERARRFVPAAAEARVTAVRACPRPQSPDGRPIVGRLDERTVVCTGHGPWGISTGPASALLAAEILQGRAAAPPELAPQRLGPAA